MTTTLSITKKELKAYFGSPMAAIFIGAFLLCALFSFFWLETFFARNSADIRPLFRWMPILMIFLAAALTMRQWSEEQRMGTMEVLFTLPVRLSHLVWGKFLAVLVLIGISLLLTLGLPITVSLLGPLDWGPVLGGYLGALLMAAAYIAIGLFISSKTDNQIIALILTVLVCSFFYLLGSAGLTGFMSNTTGELFRLLGTGSRFASIERGVIDLRDVFYYLSLTGIFLLFNTLALDAKRWSAGAITAGYRRNAKLTVMLLTINLVLFNGWFNACGSLRLDLTENNEYSISDTTRDLLANLQEPLLLRGYFSEKTHPLLAPLVPRIRDMLTEYGIASRGRVEVSFVDPKFDEEAEIEANQQYGIKPVPFQVAGRYEASVVNSYFNILVKYGDQYVTLGFSDLIEVQPRKDGQIDVRLRNLEYDLTKSIKKVVYGFQSIATIFDGLTEPLRLLLVVSADDTLPEGLREVPATIEKVVAALQKEAGGKLAFERVDAGSRQPQELKKQYGIDPLAVSFFSPDTFYMHLLLARDGKYEQVYLSGDTTEADIRKEIEAVLKRNAAGFLKTIGYWVPASETPPQQLQMYRQQPQEKYTIFQQLLRENYNLERVDLEEGRVPPSIDALLLVAPQDLTDSQRLAVDQYLMRGGSVIALTGGYALNLTPYSQRLDIKKVTGGIGDLLDHYGVKVESSLVMDRQNEPFPVPVERNLGGMRVREIRRMDYPYFVDVRKDGMAEENPVVASLPAVTLNWVSPVNVDQDREHTVLLHSSPQSWLSQSTDIQPNFAVHPDSGFAVGDKLQSYPLAVALRGPFTSFFADKPDPRKVAAEQARAARKADAAEENGKAKPADDELLAPEPIIGQSPESARLVVVGSSEFIHDTVIGIARSLGGDRYLNNLKFLQNLVDWSVEDEELLAIRSRGSQARLLLPLSRQQQTFWEWLNYGIALAALIVVSLIAALRGRRERPMELV